MSDHTKNTYERSISTVRKGLGVEGMEFLQDSARVIAWIDSSKYKPNSRKIMYIAILSTLKAQKLYETVWPAYKTKVDELNRLVAEGNEEQVLTPEEQAKFVAWPAILECLENKIFPAVCDLASFQEYLIISLYCLMPPLRLDYAEMKVVAVEPEKPEGNYLVMGKKPYILLTQYKTARRYGHQRLEVPKKLVAILKEWRSMQDTDYLLVSPASNNPMPPWELGQTIIKVFEKHLDKSVGVNVLRHSYITWMRRDDLAPKKSNDLAKAMLHTPGMSQLYRRTD
jgi:hypothetical protein